MTILPRKRKSMMRQAIRAGRSRAGATVYHIMLAVSCAALVVGTFVPTFKYYMCYHTDKDTDYLPGGRTLPAVPKVEGAATVSTDSSDTAPGDTDATSPAEPEGAADR